MNREAIQIVQHTSEMNIVFIRTAHKKILFIYLCMSAGFSFYALKFLSILVG